jgi:2-keto-4-pentenoate hydratase
MRLLLFFLVLAPIFAAESPSPEILKAAAASYLAKRPVSGIEKGFSIDDGYKAQIIFTKELVRKMGQPVGYKIGLITKPNQERLGATGPVRGTMLKKMLLPNGAKVSPHYGVKPAVELDMGVFVKDDGINDAQSLDEIVAHLSHLVCFIELVDTITATNQPMDAALLVALNVGARAGIIGEKTSMTPELARSLPNMKLSLKDDEGKTLAEVPRLELQPLENIPFLAASLKRDRNKLRKGDFISLGSPAATQPVPAGESLHLLYENLPSGPLKAIVRFSRE